jgi:hypothetical protein
MVRHPEWDQVMRMCMSAASDIQIHAQ